MFANLNQPSSNNHSEPNLPDLSSSACQNNSLFDCDSAETSFKIRIQLPINSYRGRLRERKNNKITFYYSSSSPDSSFFDESIGVDKECLKKRVVLPNNEKELKEIVRYCKSEIKELKAKFLIGEYKDESRVLIDS